MKCRNLFWGVFFILIAGLIIAKQLGLLIGINVLNLVITLLLIPIIIKSISYFNFGGVLFPIAIIGILYAKQLGIEGFIPWPILGVALFLTIGLHLIFPIKHNKKFKCITREENHKREGFEEIIDEPDNSEIYIEAKFNGSVRYINSKNLKKVNIDTSFAGVKIYLENSNISEEGAIIDLNTNFSGVEIYVSKECKIINKANISLGGIEEKNKYFSEKTDKVITIIGKASFSGITIIYI